MDDIEYINQRLQILYQDLERNNSFEIEKLVKLKLLLTNKQDEFELDDSEFLNVDTEELLKLIK
jgi:hypothetical protein